ncbi:MAG: hypothetical protein ACRDRL_27055 [Sciscionella sp.]
MRSRLSRLATATAMLGAAGAAGVVLPSSTVAAAPAPIIIGSCGSTVHAAAGQPLTLSLSRALGVQALPDIPLGVAQRGTTDYNPRKQISDAIHQLPLLGGLLGGLTDTLSNALTDGCNTTVKVANAVAAPVQSATAGVDKAIQRGAGALGGAQQHSPSNPPAQSGPNPGDGGTGGNHTGTTPGTHQASPPSADHAAGPLGSASRGLTAQPGVPLYGALGNYGSAISPAALYSGIPLSSPGLFAPSPGVRYGGQVPGYAPQFGDLGKSLTNANSTDPVQVAGSAQALGAAGSHSGGDTVGLPLLLAVLTLSGATAGLVRTWVLRRPAATG